MENADCPRKQGSGESLAGFSSFLVLRRLFEAGRGPQVPQKGHSMALRLPETFTVQPYLPMPHLPVALSSLWSSVCLMATHYEVTGSDMEKEADSELSKTDDVTVHLFIHLSEASRLPMGHPLSTGGPGRPAPGPGAGRERCFDAQPPYHSCLSPLTCCR